MLTALTVIELGGRDIAVQVAENCRTLRKKGVTVGKTIDTVIATGCIESGYELLHNDPFTQHLGLRVVARYSAAGKNLSCGIAGLKRLGAMSTCVVVGLRQRCRGRTRRRGGAVRGAPHQAGRRSGG